MTARSKLTFFSSSGVMELGEEISREAKKARKTGGLAGSSSDESESESDASDNEESDNESSKFLSSGDDDDFNPFRDESSEDDEDGKTICFIQQVAVLRDSHCEVFPNHFTDPKMSVC